MRLHRIIWKPSASKKAKALAYFLIETSDWGMVLPLRKDGTAAVDPMRAPVWRIV